MARTKNVIRELYGFRQNPFPSTAIAQWGSGDPRENGSLFNADVCAPDYEQAIDKFIVGPVDSGSKFHFLWSLGEGEEARGFGKTALLQSLSRTINKDLGARLLAACEFDECEVKETPILAAMGAFNRNDVTNLSAVSRQHVLYLAQPDHETGKSALMMLRERFVQRLRDDCKLANGAGLDAEVDAIRQSIADVALVLGGKTLGSPDKNFVSGFADADWRGLLSFLRDRDPKFGFELLSSCFIVARAAGVKRVFLFIDQVEDFASADIPKKRRSIEVERFRDLAVETQPFGEMASYVLTMHPAAARAIEQFWSLARLPRIDHLAKQSERITVVLKPVRRLEDAETLVVSYMRKFREGSTDGQSLEPFDRSTLAVLMEHTGGRPGPMLTLAHEIVEHGAREQWAHISGTQAREIAQETSPSEQPPHPRSRRRGVGAIDT